MTTRPEFETRQRAHQAKTNAWLAWIGSAVALSGAQLIAPSLPIMRDELGLTDAHLALIMSLYLLPAALASIPMGVLADKLGRRLVFGGSLIVFGVCGALVATIDTLSILLGVRFVQGLALAGLLPVTMTILGDAFVGIPLIRAHGHRTVAMGLADTVWPILGGVLVVLGWRLPWLGQMLAIPLGVAVLWKLTDLQTGDKSTRERTKAWSFIRHFREGPIIALQYAGFLRLFLKFSMLTFLPIFLVDVRNQSVAFAGLVLGTGALAGTSMAALSGRVARHSRPTPLIVSSILGMGLALSGIVTLVPVPLILVSAVLYGACDGLFGVFVNSLVTVATGPEQRGSFVAATGAVRNSAKFIAPAGFALATIVLPIATAFLLLAGLTGASALVIARMAPLEQRLARGSA